MPFTTEEELAFSWLGANGPEREREAEAHLAALEEGSDPDMAARARTMTESLNRWIEEGHPTDSGLAALLTVEAEEDAYITQQIEAIEREIGREFSDEELAQIAQHASENRDVNGAPDVEGAIDWDQNDEDQFVGLMAAELERVTDHVGRALTPEEAHELMSSIPEQARTGQAAFPDWVRDHGDRLKGRVENEQDRVSLMEERGRQVLERSKAEEGEPDEQAPPAGSDEERWERMQVAGEDAKAAAE